MPTLVADLTAGQPMGPPARNYAFYGPGQSPLGAVKTQVLLFPQHEAGLRKAYRFRMADGRSGERVHGTLRFPFYHINDGDAVEVDINGRPVHPAKIKRTPCDARTLGLPGTWFEIALQDCPPFRGDNELGIVFHAGARRQEIPYMEELDILLP